MAGPSTEQFSVRMPCALRRRMLDVIGATGNEITSSGLVVRAVETYLAILERNPSMLEGYRTGQSRKNAARDGSGRSGIHGISTGYR